MSIINFIIKYLVTKLLWLQIEYKIHAESKSNAQKENDTLEGIKGNGRVKWK